MENTIRNLAGKLRLKNAAHSCGFAHISAVRNDPSPISEHHLPPQIIFFQTNLVPFPDTASYPAPAAFFILMTAANPRSISASRLAATALAIAAALTIALRLAPDAVRGGAFLRALLFRTAFFALAGALPAAAIAFLLSRSGHPVPWRRPALAGAAAGSVAYFLTLLSLAAAYDGRILTAAQAASRQYGILTIHAPGRPVISIRPTPPDSYHLVEAVSEVPPSTAGLLASAEDERFYRRVGGLDLEAYARAALATFRALATGHRAGIQGGSEISAQLGAALLPELKPVGRGMVAFRTKVLKSAVAFRVDDTLPKSDQIRLYLALAPFGSIDGHEVIGIAAAARAFYSCEHTNLTPAQIAELFARLKNPNIFFPYPRTGEAADHFERRLARHRQRFEAILNIAARNRVLTPNQVEAAKAQFLDGLTPLDELRAAVNVPRVPQILSELSALAPGDASTRLDVYVESGSPLQAHLVNAARLTVEQLAPRLQRIRRPDDELEVDATVLAPDGAIAAEIGLASIPGGMASHLKPEFYALWVQAGHSMDDPVPGFRFTATHALAFSNNDAAKAVVARLGLKRVAGHLRSQGYFVLGPYLPIALGAGVTGSPRVVAGNFYKFGYQQPGHRIVPRWISRVVDDSGAVLYEIESMPVFPPAVVLPVRSALERAARDGTGRKALRDLASQGIAMKTGTAGFFRHGKWLGEGGSWCVAADRVTGLTIAVRVRWKSGRPFQLEGGSSAAFVVRHFIESARVLTGEGQS